MFTSWKATCLFAVVCALLSAPASAVTVFEGAFSNIEPDGSNPDVSGVGTDTLTWGTPVNSTGPSSISYQAYNVAEDLIFSGQPFRMGRMTFRNGMIELGTGISSALLFIDPFFSDDDFISSLDSFPLRMITESTPNVGTPEQNADYLFFSSFVDDPLVPEFFNVLEGATASADILATLEFLNPLRDGSPALPEFRLNVLGFANVSGDGYLTHAAIPEPNAALLGLLGCLGTLRLRRASESH